MRDAVDALGAWFDSQGIGPAEAVPIMATAIVVAVISTHHGAKDLQPTTDAVMAASRLVLQVYEAMLTDEEEED